ncbi:hypothetical protein GH714_002210 [Hevea brasiliensis]|uniref:F-box domain-containing protein n=1 Tax=Hevea brasiliensis TaxID=3981 RepID=A0A6A6KZW0_HEVBR|nr:hypothetical protein GH714_002210 [Hevea brasiliensis]
MSDRLSQKLLTEILSRLPVKSLLKCRAALWNPSVRKIVKIHFPKVNYTQKDPLFTHLGLVLIPLLMIISCLRSRGWRKVDNNLKYVMREGSTSAFLNGACHWVATKEDGISEVIVSFALGEEVFGEMEDLGPNFSIFHIWNGYEVESLVLLDEANEFAEEEASEDDGTNGVSKEPSSSPDGADKDLQKISEGKKNANSPMILNEANEIFEEVAPSSNSTIDKANEESKEEAQGESISTE